MRHLIAFLVVALFMSTNMLQAQQTTEFPIGVFTFGGNDVDYTQMKDTLGLTWVQGWGGWDGNPSALETNAKGLKVMSIRNNAYTYSKAQRMRWQAEDLAWPTEQKYMWNYFQVHPDSVSTQEADSRHSILGVHAPGYMVRDPWPNNEYHYDRIYYVATFRMKILKSTPNIDTVAVLSLYCPTHGNLGTPRVLYDSSFASDNTYYEFKVPFSLEVECDPPCEDGPAYLTGGASVRPNHIVCQNVDFRVWWAGHRTTWLDFMIVDDIEADELFAGIHNQDLRNEIDDFDALSNVKRVYLTDEPPIPGWLPHEQIKRFIRDSVLTTEKPAITASPWTDEWARRFSQDAQPSEVLWDWYVLFPSVPSPSMPEDLATNLGVAQYESNTQYNSLLQSQWDYLEQKMWPVDSVAKATGKPLWFVPQLHGTYVVNTGGFNTPQGDPNQGLRPPTGPEVQAQINLAIAFGANGIVPYPFGTDSIFWAGSEAYMVGLVSRDTNASGKHTNHFSNTTILPDQYGGTKTVYTGYSEKWDSLKSINTKIKGLEQTLISLTWQGAKSWKPNKTIATFDVVTTVSTKNTGGTADASAAVLTGQFNNRGYLYVVNRRCDTRQGNMDTRDISLTLGTQQVNWLVTEIVSDSTIGKVWVVKAGAAFTDRFGPGQGKLYRLEAATVSGTKTFNYLKFVGGAVLTLASNANITVRGNMDTVNLVLGTNAVFKADTGSTMVIARDSAFVFGSGSKLELAGVLTTTYGNYTTVPYGATLRIRPGAVLQWGSYGSLVIEGTLSAIGTVSNPITFTRAPGELAPSGIHLSYGSVDTLEHCRITELYTGVSIAYCTARVRNNEFINCTIAISSDAFKRSPLIESNTIDSCYIGLDVYTSSPIGTPVIQSNDIQHCDYGVVLNPSFGSTITNNSIHLNQTGVLVDGSTPVLRGNIIENNAVDGVYATNYSNPRFGDYAFNDPGNNIIRYNGETQIHSHYSTPFIGEIFYEPESDCENLDPSSTFGGFNSVYDPDGKSYLVLTGKSSTVTAIGTWWGQCPPDDNRFFTDGWPFYYLPALDYDPNEGMRPSILAGGGKEIQQSGQMDPRLRNAELRQALLLRSRHNYTDALALYASVIAANVNEMDIHTALQEFRHTYHDYIRWTNDTTLQGTLEGYLRTQSANHPRAAIKRLARILRASELANMGNYAGSLTEYQQLLQSSSFPDERVMCLFEMFNLNAVRLINREQAQQYLTQMQNEFPDDGRTRIAAVRFDAMTSRTSGNGLQRSSLASTSEQTTELPREFTLLQNYPNPFNPSTTIEYDLPIDAHVTLKLYDVLGREILTLVNEHTKAGYHYTTLDASRFSSGVYFYRIQAGQFSQTKKLVLVR